PLVHRTSLPGAPPVTVAGRGTARCPRAVNQLPDAADPRILSQVFAEAGSAKIKHTAIVTSANHEIGAATARALARHKSAVVCTFLRVDDAPDPGTPQTYRDNRVQNAAEVVAHI